MHLSTKDQMTVNALMKELNQEKDEVLKKVDRTEEQLQSLFMYKLLEDFTPFKAKQKVLMQWLFEERKLSARFWQTIIDYIWEDKEQT